MAGINCTPANAFETMKATKRKHNSIDGRQAYHLIISFVENEVDAEHGVHQEIGPTAMETAEGHGGEAESGQKCGDGVDQVAAPQIAQAGEHRADQRQTAADRSGQGLAESDVAAPELGGAGEDHHAHGNAQDAQQHPCEMSTFQQAPAVDAGGIEQAVLAEGRGAAAQNDPLEHAGPEGDGFKDGMQIHIETPGLR